MNKHLSYFMYAGLFLMMMGPNISQAQQVYRDTPYAACQKEVKSLQSKLKACEDK